MIVNVVPNCVMRKPLESDRVTRDGIRWVQVYCYNCGVKGFLVTEAELGPTFAGWLCEAQHNDCASKYGVQVLGGTGNYVPIPDELFWQAMHAEMIEKYGRILTAPELELVIADSSSSSLAKLLLDRFTPGKFGQ